MIDSMLAAVTPGSKVWWVNLDYHLDPWSPFDFVGGNVELQYGPREPGRTDRRPSTVIDWYSLAESHIDWFFDPVHVDSAGSRARAQQVVDALAN